MRIIRIFIIIDIILLVAFLSQFCIHVVKNITSYSNELTYSRIEASISNPVSIKRFNGKIDSIYFLFVPETKEKNSILLGISYGNSMDKFKIDQSIDLGGFYDEMFLDGSNKSIVNIIDSNNLSKPLVFNCGKKKDNKLYVHNDIKYGEIDLETSNFITKKEHLEFDIDTDFVIDINPIMESEYVFYDILRDKNRTATFIMNIDFKPEFLINGTNYIMGEFTPTYCFTRAIKILG